MGSISFIKLVVIFFFVLLIFGDFSYLIDKIKSHLKDSNKKTRKKGS